MRTRTAIAIILAFTLMNACQAQARTEVSGDISGSVTWQESKSPYYVTGGIWVEEGAVLTIEPGTVVKFTSGQGISIWDASGGQPDGRLVCLGTEAKPIVFTSYRDDESDGDDTNQDGLSQGQPGDWADIVVFPDDVLLQHCVFRFGGGNSSYGVVDCYGSPALHHCAFEHAACTAVRVYKYEGVDGGVIADCVFTNCADSYTSALELWKCTNVLVVHPVSSASMFGNSTP